MAHLLGGESLHVSFPTRTVFEGITIGVDEGDRVGIVGRNGDGKSTLLSLLARRLSPDAGRVTWRSGVRVGYLDQSDVLTDDHSVGHAIVGETPEYVWASDARVRDVITGLVADLDWEAPISSLSGGQRRRVALVQLLAGDWDVLMLDEPNNSMRCSFRTPRFYRRGRATSRPDARRRLLGRRYGVPCRTAPVGRGGR